MESPLPRGLANIARDAGQRRQMLVLVSRGIGVGSIIVSPGWLSSPQGSRVFPPQLSRVGNPIEVLVCGQVIGEGIGALVVAISLEGFVCARDAIHCRPVRRRMEYALGRRKVLPSVPSVRKFGPSKRSVRAALQCLEERRGERFFLPRPLSPQNARFTLIPLSYTSCVIFCYVSS